MLALILLAPFVVQSAQTLVQRVSGYILLQVESHGEAWYVDPVQQKATYMADGAAAYQIMRSFGLGITNTDLALIPSVSDVQVMRNATSICASNSLAQRLSGRILLQVQAHGEAWYVYPKNCRRIYLANGPAAYDVMAFLGLGISNTDLASIPKAGIPTVPEPTEKHWSHKEEAVQTSRGTFTADVVRLERNRFDMIVDVAELTNTPDLVDCEGGCAQWSLAEYVQKNNGVVGIHGTYFCPPDYAPCVNRAGEFLVPLVDSSQQQLINAHKMEFHFGPMLAQDTLGGLHYYHRTKEFASISQFESSTGKQIYSAVSNYPSLVENGVNIVNNETLDNNQKTVMGARGAIGYNETTIFLVIAHSATVIDLASMMQTLGADYALNLDGGATAALYVDGRYEFGPGRALPNALVFRAR